MKNFFERENFFPMAVSLVLACVLWLYVMSEQNPLIERNYVVKLQQRNLAENMIVLDAPENVKVRVRGQRSIIGGIADKDISAYIDCSRNTVGQQYFPVFAQFPEGDVVEVSPVNVYAYIDYLTEKTMPVETRIIGLPSAEYSLGKRECVPEQVVVKGAKHRLELMTKVLAPVDVAAKDKAFQAECRLVAISGNGNEMTDLVIKPLNAQVKVEVLPQPVIGELPIVVTTTGSMGDGSGFLRADSLPTHIKVQSDAATLKKVLNIHTKELDLSKVTTERELTLELDFPAKVTSDIKTVKVKLITNKD